MHHRECIDRDIGYGCHEEDVMHWRCLGGRLGVDSGDLLWLVAEYSVILTRLVSDKQEKM